MELEKKASLIVEFIQAEFNNPVFDDFYDYNDLGIPLAVAFEADVCTLNDKGVEVLNETYALLCDELGIDNKDYNSYDDMVKEMPKD